jgi:hypothetical protein
MGNDFSELQQKYANISTKKITNDQENKKNNENTFPANRFNHRLNNNSFLTKNIEKRWYPGQTNIGR